MATAASRDLRNHTRALLDRASAGERITITVDGRPTAQLTPLDERRTWIPRDEFIQIILANQADPGLTDELEELASDTTDDLPL